jgi:hypothetical protein
MLGRRKHQNSISNNSITETLYRYCNLFCYSNAGSQTTAARITEAPEGMVGEAAAKDVVKVPTSNKERVRKHRERNKTKKQFSGIVRVMTGEDTGSGTYNKQSSTLVCIDKYKAQNWATWVTSSSDDDEKMKVLKALSKNKLAYTETSRGYVGVSPPVLIANLFRELNVMGGPSMEKAQWKKIQIRTGLGERRGGKAYYYMFHWGNRKNAEENNVPDWKDEDKFFSTLVKDMIDEFAFKITSRFLSKSKSPIDTKESFLEWHSVLPGMVKTESAYNQAAHTDFNGWGLIIHMPLSREGMMLRIWDTETVSGSRVASGEYHYIPFGCYFVIPSYVKHSGVYGTKGNCCFHMIIRRKAATWEKDEIKPGQTKDEPENRPNWKNVFNERRNEGSKFCDSYVEYMKQNLGGTFSDTWLK